MRGVGWDTSSLRHRQEQRGSGRGARWGMLVIPLALIVVGLLIALLTTAQMFGALLVLLATMMLSVAAVSLWWGR